MVRKIIFAVSVLLIGNSLWAQVFYNPNVAIKPMTSMNVHRVVLTDTTTIVTVRIENKRQLAPFFIRTKNLIIRKVGDHRAKALQSSSNVPFYPQKHTFSFQDEVYEFTLVFPALEKPVKYFDIVEESPQREFYLQGIILDPDLNKAISAGFRAYQLGDREGALKAFQEAAEMDLYFEYGMIYFNILYLLAELKRWEEAKEWYKKFQDRFFYDKELFENELNRLGILQRLR